MSDKYIDLLEFVPKSVISYKENKEFPIQVNGDDNYLMLKYYTNGVNQTGRWGEREYSLTVPRKISWSNETFEVLGLLQAEMTKAGYGCLIFCNHEYKLINKVIKWFKNELEINYNDWRWSIVININEPKDENYKKEVENKVINYWLNKTKIDINRRAPKTVFYREETKNKKLEFYDYGTLRIEYKSNLFFQIIKNYVNLMSFKMPKLDEEAIRGFMKGIIAGESNVELNRKSRHYRVFITAIKSEERELYQMCSEKLGIYSKQSGKLIVISRRENNIQLLKQRLMTLSKEKYAKFRYMMQCYPEIKEETGYFNKKGELMWNKTSKEKIDKIIKLYKSGLTNTKEVAERVGVSRIKVQRVLKENNLGKRMVPHYPIEILKKVIELYKETPNIKVGEAAKILGISKSAVIRARNKFGIKTSYNNCLKTSKDKIERIIQIYKENPIAKMKDICKEVGVSDTVVSNVRKRYGLKNLGFMHLIGNNNRKYKSLLNSDNFSSNRRGDKNIRGIS